MYDLIAAALILSCLPAGILASMSRARAKAFRRQLLDAIEEAESAHADLVAQSSLEQSFAHLRASLYALGPPRRDGQNLFFGGTLINAHGAILEDVKIQYGAIAAVYLGDQRIATSEPNPDATRAASPQLPRGPARERALGAGLSHHGELELAGERYMAIHEPILADGEVIGLIFAAVPRPVPLPAAARAGMTVSLTALRAILQAQADTLHRSQAARLHAEDRRRREDQKQPAYQQAA